MTTSFEILVLPLFGASVKRLHRKHVSSFFAKQFKGRLTVTSRICKEDMALHTQNSELVYAGLRLTSRLTHLYHNMGHTYHTGDEQ
jgi:hypothetical protein